MWRFTDGFRFVCYGMMNWQKLNDEILEAQHSFAEIFFHWLYRLSQGLITQLFIDSYIVGIILEILVSFDPFEHFNRSSVEIIKST